MASIPAPSDPVQVSELVAAKLYCRHKTYHPCPQAEFHGVQYTVRTTVAEGASLTVEVEQLSEASRWRGDFSAQCEICVLM